MENRVLWIWHQLVFGVGTRRSELMLGYFGSPDEIFERYSTGMLDNMLSEDESGRARNAADNAQRIHERTLKKGCQVITPDDADYPALLHEIYSKPAALYVKGDLGCLKDRLCIAMVGSRRTSEYGEKAGEMIASALAASGVTIVSGLAVGIDSICHEAALKQDGYTVGFLGCGIDVDYPSGSAKLKRGISGHGAVVTEFPLGTEPLPYNFPIRNRLISGVSRGVVVVEADKKSGSLLTANHAIEQGRDLYGIPGSIFSAKRKGVHSLLKECGKLIDSAADILIEYPEYLENKKIMNKTPPDGITINEEAVAKNTGAASKPVHEKKQPPESLSGNARLLYDMFGDVPIVADEAAVRSGLPVGDVLSALTELEIYGLIRIYPGRLFGIT